LLFGGGSVLDYAKVANSLTTDQNLEENIKNSNYSLNGNFSKLLAIPTTAGSGAEVTSNAVIYVDKIKYSVEGENIKTRLFFFTS
jgi:alcohol dehydrogenase class IV